MAQCDHCQQAWEEKTLPTQLRPTVRELKKSTRFVLWSWAGVALFVLLMAGTAIGGRYHEHDRLG